MSAAHAHDTSVEVAVEVAVNLLWCVPGEVGGSEEYLVRQLLGLAERSDQRWRLRLHVLPGFARAHPDVADAFDVVAAPFDGHSRARRIAGESTYLRRRTAGASLVHHGGGTAPPFARRPYVLTVHDLQYLTFPEHFSTPKLRYLHATMPRSARGAAVVAVPTEYVRSTVVQHLGVPERQVVVVPHGIEPTLAQHVTPEAELRRMYALGDGPLLVYPAVTHPHKNHRFLLQMMRDHWTDPDLRLVLTGGQGAAEHEITACDDLRVCRVGRVPEAHRNGLLAAASALVFPSRYEGFGAPLIEAMSLGAPVVCSDAACLPEVVGEAGLVLPLDPSAWADVPRLVAARRSELVASGHRRARQFTARASGDALAAAYAQAVDER